MTDDTAAADSVPGDSSDPTLTTEDGAPLPYGDAVEELEAILAELDGSTVDVDHLAEQVRRAADLVRYCRQRLEVVRADVADVVDDLDGTSTETPADAADG